MGVTAILGLQWGDEGKGKIVDALCNGYDIVVRCQGGANAGHTVVIGDDKYVFHMIPSGILRDQVICVVGSGVVVDLDVLDQEVNHLIRKNIPVIGRLMISKKAHVVMPFHKDLDVRQESMRGEARIGTTGRGIGPCYADKYARVGIRLGDVLDDDALRSRLKILLNYHNQSKEGSALFDFDQMISFVSRFRDLVKEVAFDTERFLLNQIKLGKMVLLEGSQGFLLDIDHGTYPYVTSCSTGIGGLCAGSGIPPSSITKVIGVVKAYVTRVGGGPMPTEMEEPIHSRTRQMGGEFGATTGRPRRCGWIDLVTLRYASLVNGVTSIAVSKLDTLAGLDQIKVCRAYECDGNVVSDFPAEAESLYRCKPIYDLFKGWGDLSGIKKMGGLPREALEFIEAIANAAGCSVEVVSVGPSREQLIRP